ncbi:MAG: hypothetical protein ACREQ5_05515 [Candidatus Dormibacteria bacterium]
MSNTNPTITSLIGTSTVDQTVIPYMRAREVEIAAENLRPARAAQFFFGDVNVTRFVQRSSRLVPDTANANSALTRVVRSQERFYCNNTHAFASAIGAANGTIYINEDYVCVNVSVIGANSFTAGQYSVGDIVYQIPTVNPSIQTPTFEGRVAYWNSSDKVLVVEPILGTLSTNTVANSVATLWHSGYNDTVLANTVVNGNLFPLNAQVVSLDNVAHKFLIQTYDHRMGLIANTITPNANCFIITGPAPSDLVGNVVFFTSGTGLGQPAICLSTSGNVVYTNTVFSPTGLGNTSYSLGPNYVDATGHLFGVFQLPETATVNFLTGAHKFTITDSPIVDDPDSTMTAAGNYVSAGFLGAGTSTPSTPIVQPVNGGPSASVPISSTPSTSIGSVTNPTVLSASAGPNTSYAGIVSQVNANVAANGMYNGVSIQWPYALFDVDPIAQTFITPPPKSLQTNFGIFVSSIDIWFNVRPVAPSPAFPVQLMIAETVNGVPTSNVIASITVQWEDIKVSTTPDSINVGSSIANNNTVTRFAFNDPVYLQPSTNYAIILYSESPDYEVYIAKVGSADISTAGANIRRISQIPGVGSFFKSQNASAWTPLQNQMLMFVLNKAVFSTSPVSFTFNNIPIHGTFFPYDTLLIGSSDMGFSATSITYKVQTIQANTGVPDPTYTQVVPGVVYDFAGDLKTSSAVGTRRRIIIPGNNQVILTQVSLQTNDPDVSPVFNAERLFAVTTTNIINKGSISSENISVLNGNHINAANIVVTIGPPDLIDGIQATANVQILNGNSIPFITVTNPGAGYSIAPSITISEPGAPANAIAAISGENGISGGNGATRYITRQVTLAEGMDSGDLRVYLSAIRPVGTDIEVYYKALSAFDSQSFANLPWQKMTIVKDINSPDHLTPIALQYCPSLGPNGLPAGTLSYMYKGIQYPLGGKFKYFSIKIVMFALDPTVAPSVQTMQAVALPAG